MKKDPIALEGSLLQIVLKSLSLFLIYLQTTFLELSNPVSLLSRLELREIQNLRSKHITA